MCKKKYKKIFAFVFAFIFVLTAFSLSAIVYTNNALPSEYSVFEGERLNIKSNIPIKAEYQGENISNSSVVKASSKNYTVNLKALGIFPIKQANVSVVSENSVLVLGKPFGIKIYTDGVMVVGIDNVLTENGKVTPAENAGLKKGDIIVSINSQYVYSNEDVAKIIEESGGNEIILEITRDGKPKTIKVKPALCYESGKYKTGIWVRDSSAGIGTLTFYNPAKNVVCGLGHGVCDVDTGNLLTLNSGELVEAEIIGVNKGTEGSPGELMGRFKENCLGELKLNNDTGVYAECDIDYENDKLCTLALKQEVEVGEAYIYSTVDGETPKYYKCMIEKIAHNNSMTKNLVIKITDERLIETTGGIVQGMSGSPIIQNGKLIGAVTHVLVDDPTKGYGIFAENMLETAQGVANNVGDSASTSRFKDAS